MSTLIYVTCQVSLRAADTLAGKHALENYAAECGVDIAKYRGDNQIFNSQEYLKDCEAQQQKLTFVGLERTIKMVSQNELF